jgi:hypothetical protein
MSAPNPNPYNAMLPPIYQTAYTITTSDTTPQFYRAIYVGGTGDLSIVDAGGGTAVVFKAVPVGTIIPIATTLVKATNTTATLLIGLI